MFPLLVQAEVLEYIALNFRILPASLLKYLKFLYFMTDNLLTGAFILFALGMSLLLAIYYISEPSSYTISELLENEVEHFQTSGYVRQVADRGNVLFITLEEQCSLSGMVFADGTDFFDYENTFVVVKGHVSSYRDSKTFIFTEIRRG
jgi:hypothetical protein